MEVLDRVYVNPNICEVELAFKGSLAPSAIPGWQEFYNSIMIDTDFSKTYIGLGSVSFGEESEKSAAGTSYKQSVSIRFPSSDGNRAERIALMDKVRFVKLKLTNGKNLVIGRNDYTQNTRPKINIKTNVKTAEVVFETVSIFPSGFLPMSSNSEIYPLIPVILS